MSSPERLPHTPDIYFFQGTNIVSEGDLEIAAKKQEAYLKTQVGTNSGTMVEIPKKKAFNENH